MSLDTLRATWTTLYATTLPQLAKARSPVQPKWPVVLDHCFARIILDNAVGVTTPWMQAVRAPAVKHMTEVQLNAAIDLGTAIVEGREDLCVLNARSLELRGKEGRKGAKGAKNEKEKGALLKEGSQVLRAQEGTASSETEGGHVATPKRKAKSVDDKDTTRVKKQNTGTISKYFSPPSADITRTSEMKSPAEVQSKLPVNGNSDKLNRSQQGETASELPSESTHDSKQEEEADNTSIDPLQLIANSEITPFRKEVLTLLCSIPPGKYTTYAAMARHVNHVRSAGKTATSQTCARAIGNAMRNNPFAPLVPCHRVLATGGNIGGFGGDWGDDGKHAAEKRRLLREEGLRFDGKGKAIGNAWEGWK